MRKDRTFQEIRNISFETNINLHAEVQAQIHIEVVKEEEKNNIYQYFSTENLFHV